MYDIVYIEISGACNASCPLCPTWHNTPRFIGVQAFRQAIEHIVKEKMIGTQSRIGLYNWGEPTLHPQFKEIVQYMSTTHIKFGLSTNASILQLFDNPTILTNLRPLAFSMCGFSQASYNRIQGLSFENAKMNIAQTIGNYRACGFHYEAYIKFHVYQFNLHEIQPAREFASRFGIHFFPYYAHLNQIPTTIDYLTNKTARHNLEWMQQNMVLSHVPDVIAGMPDDWQCPEHNRLIIDEQLNVRTCCVCPPHDKEYHLGNLLNMTEEKIQAKRMQPICHKCAQTGAAYWIYEGQKLIPKQPKQPPKQPVNVEVIVLGQEK